MRSVILRGITDQIKVDLGQDISLIADVIELGKCRDYLIYDLELNGHDLIKFLEEHFLKINEEIILENKYVITAYDW